MSLSDRQNDLDGCSNIIMSASTEHEADFQLTTRFRSGNSQVGRFEPHTSPHLHSYPPAPPHQRSPGFVRKTTPKCIPVHDPSRSWRRGVASSRRYPKPWHRITSTRVPTAVPIQATEAVHDNRLGTSASQRSQLGLASSISPLTGSEHPRGVNRPMLTLLSCVALTPSPLALAFPRSWRPQKKARLRPWPELGRACSMRMQPR
jgi:hypothetical protein